MSDQCANCDVRGHFDKCEGVECGHHENWYPNELKKQLAAAEQRAETLKDERDMYDARATEYWEDVLELSDKLEDAEQRAEKAEKDVISAQAEFVEILHNRQAKIEALKTAERNAVRECEKLAIEFGPMVEEDGIDAGMNVASYGISDEIRNRYPQHFEEE